MKFLFITIITSIIFGKCFSQKINYQTEEISIEKFTYSECDEDCFLESKIINQEYTENSYILTIGAYLNCSGDFVSYLVPNSDTLKIYVIVRPNVNDIVEYVDCDCYYQLDYLVEGLENAPKVITINNETLERNFEKRGPVILD